MSWRGRLSCCRTTRYTYVYGLDLISLTAKNRKQTYYLYDGLGSTTGLTDESGAVTATFAYDVFGELRPSSSPSNQWLFTGEQRDADSGLYYLRARYYDPSTGRFLSRDPLGGGNEYAYASNNPVNLVDPLGLCGTNNLGDVWDCVEDAFECASNDFDCVENLNSEEVIFGVRVALSVAPVIGDLNDAVAVVTGYDVIWGEHISPAERLLTLAGMLPGPGGSGSLFRKGFHLADDAMQVAPAVAKIHGNSFASTSPTTLYRLKGALANT